MRAPGQVAADPRREGVPVAVRRRTGERLVALLLAGAVALNFPLFSLLGGRGLVAGIPALFLYLFLVWLLLAAGTAFVLRKRPPEREGRDEGDRPDES